MQVNSCASKSDRTSIKDHVRYALSVGTKKSNFKIYYPQILFTVLFQIFIWILFSQISFYEYYQMVLGFFSKGFLESFNEFGLLGFIIYVFIVLSTFIYKPFLQKLYFSAITNTGMSYRQNLGYVFSRFFRFGMVQLVSLIINTMWFELRYPFLIDPFSSIGFYNAIPFISSIYILVIFYLENVLNIMVWDDVSFLTSIKLFFLFLKKKFVIILGSGLFLLILPSNANIIVNLGVVIIRILVNLILIDVYVNHMHDVHF